jgi:probable phosphoglycerate mutase
VCTSPSERGLETSAAVAAPHALTPEIEPAFLELHLGSWQGRLMSDFTDEEALHYRAWEQDPTSVTPPNGETMNSALNRIAPVLDKLLVTHAGTTVVIVSHSIIGRVALSYLLGFGVELVPLLRLKKASVTKLRVHNGMTIMERLSDTAHLRSLP